MLHLSIMGRAYSQDLRLRVLQALDEGMSKMQAHRTFRVSRSTIDDWLALREHTGQVQPKARPGRTGRGAFPGHEVFEAFARHHRESTLWQMQVAWEQEFGQRLSTMTFSSWLRRIGWTRKKRVGVIASATKPSENASDRF